LRCLLIGTLECPPVTKQNAVARRSARQPHAGSQTLLHNGPTEGPNDAELPLRVIPARATIRCSCRPVRSWRTIRRRIAPMARRSTPKDASSSTSTEGRSTRTQLSLEEQRRRAMVQARKWIKAYATKQLTSKPSRLPDQTSGVLQAKGYQIRPMDIGRQRLPPMDASPDEDQQS